MKTSILLAGLLFVAPLAHAQSASKPTAVRSNDIDESTEAKAAEDELTKAGGQETAAESEAVQSSIAEPEKAEKKAETPKPAAKKVEAKKADVLKPGKVPAHVESDSAKTVVDGVTADQALKFLENGNARYTTHKFRTDGRSEKERAKKEAKPHTIILSCSDSRVPPEIIFDQGLGEVVTIRVAGEVLDESVIASIEQAVINEHPHLLVVLGHTQCASIEAAFNWKDKPTFGSDALDRMVAEIKPHLKTVATQARSPGLQIEAALQADGVARDLTERSDLIKKAVTSGELTIKTGLYWVDSGKVKFY